jgi:hypothetical protein
MVFSFAGTSEKIIQIPFTIHNKMKTFANFIERCFKSNFGGVLLGDRKWCVVLFLN